MAWGVGERLPRRDVSGCAIMMLFIRFFYAMGCVVGKAIACTGVQVNSLPVNHCLGARMGE